MEVRFEPLKEIVIMDKNLFSSPDELARFASIAAGGHPVSLFWANEILLLYYPIPASSETTVKELVEKGKIYWLFVGYANMKIFQPIIETKEKIMVPVVNMASNGMFRKVTEWLRNYGYPEDNNKV